MQSASRRRWRFNPSSLALCAALGAIACRPAVPVPPAPLPDEYRGIFHSGFEANRFTGCDERSPIRYDVAIVDSAAAAAIRSGAATPAPMSSVYQYVRWRARVRDEPRSMSAPRPLTLEVFEVLEVRAPRPGECGLNRIEHMPERTGSTRIRL